MQIQAAAELLQYLLRLNHSAPALTGPPGVGKTVLVQEAARALGIEYRRVEMAFLQTEDLCGIPYREGDHTFWTKPYWFPEQGDGVLALEDFNRVSDPNVLNCQMGLLLDRRLHAFVLPPGWRVAATMNVGARFLTTGLDAAHVSRIAVIDVESDAASVAAWGKAHGRHPLVLEFLLANPTYLFQLPATDGQKPWPNPRSWLDGVGANLPGDAGPRSDPATLQMLVGTFVGDTAAVGFVNWLFTSPPSCKEILERPLAGQARFRFTTDQAVLMQRLLEFTDYLAKTAFRSGHWENLRRFLELVPADALPGFVHAMQKKHPDLVWTKELTTWKRTKTS